MLNLEKLSSYLQDSYGDYEIINCIKNAIKLNPNYTIDDFWNLINGSIQSLVINEYWFAKVQDTILITRRSDLQYIAKVTTNNIK